MGNCCQNETPTLIPYLSVTLDTVSLILATPSTVLKPLGAASVT